MPALPTSDGDPRMSRQDHWKDHARQWGYVGPPLRPCAEDIRLARELVGAGGADTGGRRHAILLGVTPELVSMDWPRGTRLTAVDRCMEMIRGVFPREGLSVPAWAVCGDWLNLPLPDEGADWVVGDGCYTLLDGPARYRELGREVHRILRPGGRYLARMFLRPDSPEPAAAVFDDLEAGRIGNFHVFKWRLAMALHDGAGSGVRVDTIWERWRQAGIDPGELARDTGWPEAEILTIEAYQGSKACYTYPTLDEARAALSVRFRELACRFPGYELGERCPTLLLERA